MLKTIYRGWIFFAAILFLSMAALLSACSAGDDGTTSASDETEMSAAPPAADLPDLAGLPDLAEESAGLPPPSRWTVGPPVLNPDEQRRHQEVERFLVRRYRGQRIVETTQTYIGDIVDWFDPATVPGSDKEPPPRPSPAELQPPPGTQLQLTELDLHPELRGPAGTIPVVRPPFEEYVRGRTEARSLEDYLADSQAPGQRAGRTRLYAGMAVINASRGAVSDINQFSGPVEAGTFTLLEMAVMTRGSDPNTTHEQVGVAISRDRKNFGDSAVRLQVEFMTRGLEVTGDGIGGWDGKFTGFMAAAGRPYAPGQALVASTIDGPQYASHVEIRVFGTDWWIAHNGNWLGYYPGYLFDLIPLFAEEVHWYGEVFDPTPATWTSTGMGSGRFAAAGDKKAAYFNEPYSVDILGVPLWPDNAQNVSPNDSACYTRTNLLTGGAGHLRYFYLGGPGGGAAGCK